MGSSPIDRTILRDELRHLPGLFVVLIARVDFSDRCDERKRFLVRPGVATSL